MHLILCFCLFLQGEAASQEGEDPGGVQQIQAQHEPWPTQGRSQRGGQASWQINHQEVANVQKLQAKAQH